MENTFTVQTEYKIHYTTEAPVSIDHVIDSLRSLERIIKRTGPFVEKAFEGVKVYDTQVYISEIKSGSLKDHFIVKYLCGGEENAEKAEELFNKMMEDSGGLKTVVSVGVGAVMMYGLMQLIPSGEPRKHTEAYNSVVIEAGADVNLSGESIREILEAQRDKKAIAKDAVDAVRPAKGDNSSIRIEGFNKLTIPSNVVLEAPDEYEPPIPVEKEEKYQDVKVLISASDRDNNEKGWAGIVVGVAETRTKIVLADNLDPRDLHGRTQIQANVVVTSRYRKSKKGYSPQLIEITAYQ
ncbi:hypothetical protein [Alloalcanivorax xenomutans]